MRRIRTKADMDHFDTLIHFIDTCNNCTRQNDNILNKIRLACEEIIINIISYAYPGSTGDITIKYDMRSGKSITITFIDRGIPFNPLEKEKPNLDLPAQDREIGGLGIFIIRKIMDEVGYKRKHNMNFFTIKKNLGSSMPADTCSNATG